MARNNDPTTALTYRNMHHNAGCVAYLAFVGFSGIRAVGATRAAVGVIQ